MLLNAREDSKAKGVPVRRQRILGISQFRLVAAMQGLFYFLVLKVIYT